MKRSVDFKSRGVKLFPGKDNSNKFSICESTLCYSIMVNLWYAYLSILFFFFHFCVVLLVWSMFSVLIHFAIALFEHRNLPILLA